MTTVREILDAARALPRPDRLRLVEQLSEELRSRSREPVRSGDEAAEEFQHWLQALLKRAPKAPPLPPEAFGRDQIYDD